uniref:Uncharacterized protein n=1 Tax=Arundo donax TaxID=35708 RepID=A0A0A8Y0B7_ARUDO
MLRIISAKRAFGYPFCLFHKSRQSNH